MSIDGASEPTRPRRKAGRPAAIDEAAIARAVLDVGFRDLTFAAVAERLGIGQATLYRHASNRDALVRLGLELAMTQMPWPSLKGPWQDVLERQAVFAWRAWEQLPGAVLEVSRGIIPTAVVAASDRVTAMLTAQSFTTRNAVLAVDLVFDLVADNRRGVETLGIADKDVRGAFESTWLAAVPAEDTEGEIHNEVLRAIRMDPFDWFRLKLDVVLSGIRTTLAPEGRS